MGGARVVGRGGTRRARLSGLPANQIAKQEVNFGCGRAGQRVACEIGTENESEEQTNKVRILTETGV